MISIPDLRAEIERTGPVVLSMEDGRIQGPVHSASLTSPAALVLPVTDALKNVTPPGVVTGHTDREEAWRIVAVYLDGRAVAVLEDDQMSAEDLYEAVAAAGLRWEARPFDEVLQQAVPESGGERAQRT